MFWKVEKTPKKLGDPKVGGRGPIVGFGETAIFAPKKFLLFQMFWNVEKKKWVFQQSGRGGLIVGFKEIAKFLILQYIIHILILLQHNLQTSAYFKL